MNAGGVIGLIKALGGSGGGSSGGGALVVHIDENDALDKTWQEIHDAPFAVVKDGALIMPVIEAGYSGKKGYYLYGVYFTNGTLLTSEFNTPTADGYPSAP